MIDTEGGQSGSPIFFYEKETQERLVVAIRHRGSPTAASASPRRCSIAIQGWIADPPPDRPPPPKSLRPSGG